MRKNKLIDMDIKLDKTDKLLLNVIQEGDCCVPKVTHIAKKTGLPHTKVHNRLKKL